MARFHTMARVRQLEIFSFGACTLLKAIIQNKLQKFHISSLESFDIIKMWCPSLHFFYFLHCTLLFTFTKNLPQFLHTFWRNKHLIKSHEIFMRKLSQSYKDTNWVDSLWNIARCLKYVHVSHLYPLVAFGCEVAIFQLLQLLSGIYPIHPKFHKFP